MITGLIMKETHLKDDALKLTAHWLKLMPEIKTQLIILERRKKAGRLSIREEQIKKALGVHLDIMGDAYGCLSSRQAKVIQKTVIQGRALSSVGDELGHAPKTIGRAKRSALRKIYGIMNVITPEGDIDFIRELLDELKKI